MPFRVLDGDRDVVAFVRVVVELARGLLLDAPAELVEAAARHAARIEHGVGAEGGMRRREPGGPVEHEEARLAERDEVPVPRRHEAVVRDRLAAGDGPSVSLRTDDLDVRQDVLVGRAAHRLVKSQGARREPRRAPRRGARSGHPRMSPRYAEVARWVNAASHPYVFSVDSRSGP